MKKIIATTLSLALLSRNDGPGGQRHAAQCQL